MLKRVEAYSAPFKGLQNVPTQRLSLAHLPTPIEQWSFGAGKKEFSLLLKRDDLSEGIAGGNKIRKLEFIFAEVLEGKHDCVISIGGTGVALLLLLCCDVLCVA